MNNPTENADPEMVRMLAEPQFLADPVFSKDHYMMQAAGGLMGHFLRDTKQAPEVFKQVEPAHADSNSYCCRVMVTVENKRLPIVAWTFDLDAQGPNGKSGRELFVMRAKQPNPAGARPSPTEIVEHVLGRRVLRIQVESGNPSHKLPGQYEICQLKNIGWYVAGLTLPTLYSPAH